MTSLLSIIRNTIANALKLQIMLSVFFLVGCNFVVSKQIIGESIQEDLSETFDGAWACEGYIFGDDMESEVAHVYVNYVKTGELRVASIDWDKRTSSFKTEEYTYTLSECNDDLQFINSPENDEEGFGEARLFALYALLPVDNIIIWMPNPDSFEVAISQGKLKGETRKGNSRIDDNPETICGYIQENKIADLFLLEFPTICRKVRSIEYEVTQSDESLQYECPSGTSDCVNFDEVTEKNRLQLEHLMVGMTKVAVSNIMGTETIATGGVPSLIPNPVRTELIEAKPNLTYEIHYYYTDVKTRDGVITGDELTPIVFRNEKLIGWGYAILASIKNE